MNKTTDRQIDLSGIRRRISREPGATEKSPNGKIIIDLKR
jgi:hypothetical protein